ncbi:MAG: hypothetical protein JWR27_290 [Aeromicrobium sp.]|nr:hypothetical protein [Aeromicrobium sp.]
MSLRAPALLVALLVGLVAPAMPAAAADPSPAGATTVAVEGTVIRTEIDHFGDVPSSTSIYAVRTDEGLDVPVSSAKELVADGMFTGELVIRGAVARELESQDLLPAAGRTVDQDSKAGSAALAVAAEDSVPMPVAEATVLPADETSASATPSAHRAYVVKMTDQGSVDGDNASIGAAVDTMLSYWVTESDAAISSFGRVGPILGYDSAADVPPSQGCGLQDPYMIWNDAVGLFPGVNFDDPGNHLIVLVGEECGYAGSVGVASVGSSLADGGPSILTYDPQTFQSTGVHELGHNFGLGHANRDSCGGSRCEYFDLYSPMGLSIGGGSFSPPALGTLYRTQLGLATPEEVTTVALGDGQTNLDQTFSLTPRASAAGRRGLLVTDPATGTTYSVDWRSHTARDASTFYGSSYNLGSGVPEYPSGIVVERTDGTEMYLTTHTTTAGAVGAFAPKEVFSPSARLTITVGEPGTVRVVITALPVVGSARPTISGTKAVGRTVSAVAGTWTRGTTFAYDWRLDNVSTGQRGSTYAIPASAVGKKLTVKVTGTKAGYAAVTTESAASTVAKGTLATRTPTISGTAKVGKTLTATAGTWTSGTALTYRWYVGSKAITQSSTSRTYKIAAAYKGKKLTVEVTGAKAGYTTVTKTSSASKAIAK